MAISINSSFPSGPTYDKLNKKDAAPDGINRQLSQYYLKNAAQYAASDFYKHVTQKIGEMQKISKDSQS